MEKEFQRIKTDKILGVIEGLKKQGLIDEATQALLAQYFDRYKKDKVRKQTIKDLEKACQFDLMGINDAMDIIIYALNKETEQVEAKIYFRRQRMELRKFRI